MNGTTLARPTTKDSAHWYTAGGEPCYEITGKTTGKPRPVNIADAREQGLLPSVTTILKVLHKEALVNWMIEQAVLATLTAPRQPGEETDAFVQRVLHTERQQDQESQLARDRGTEIHAALEALLLGQKIEPSIEPWIMPAYQAIMQGSTIITTEQVLIGNGFAGRTDAITKNQFYTIWDFKSTKKLPDPKRGGAWPEHRLQLAAYAKAFCESAFATDNQITPDQVIAANCYVSTIEEGQFSICQHENWPATFEKGFVPLLVYWQWANRFTGEPVKDAPPKESAAALIGRPAARATQAPARQPGTHVVRDVGIRVLPPPASEPLPPMPVRRGPAIATEASANVEIDNLST